MKRLLLKVWRSFPAVFRGYVREFYESFKSAEPLFLGAGIAFNVILCLIPLLLILTFTIGTILHGSSGAVRHRIDDVLDTVFPLQPYALQIRASIQNLIDDIIKYRSAFGYSGLISFIWTATSLFSAVRTSLNRIYRIRSRKLAYIKMLENVALVVVTTGLFLAANIFSWALRLVDVLVRNIPGLEGVNVALSLKSIPFGAEYLSAFATFAIVNRFAPDERIPWRAALVSAFTATTLWWAAGKGFRWYLSAFHPYNKLYGTYTFLLVFLIWTYYSAAAFIVGAIVGQLYRVRHEERATPGRHE